ncbi:MAG: phosphatase PAP2 family protein [Bacteroidota bacterium]
MLIVCLAGTCVRAQIQDTVPSAKLYRVKPIISIPVIATGFYFGQEQLKEFRDKTPLTQMDLDNLNPDDVPGIDQWGLRQDPAKAEAASKASDVLFIAGQVAPFTLFVFKEYRKEWVDISLMYLEAQMLQGLFYGYAPFGPAANDRKRPRVYYDEVDFEDRTNSNAQNSLFSGHASTAATGFYFYVKMVVDHNPDLTGGQKALIYGAATVPGIATAILRVRGLYHFPTDTAIGLGVGAISGILVPEFHKWWQRKHETKAMVTPLYGGGAAGVGFTLQF